MKDAMKKEGKAQAALLRDLMDKANPGFLATEDGRAVVATSPPAGDSLPSEETSGEKLEAPGTSGSPITAANAAIPPEWAFDDEDESGDEVNADDLKSFMMSALPFKNDMDIWKLMNTPGAHALLVSVLDEAIPKDVKRSTETSEYSIALVKSLFDADYPDDHRIPTRADNEEDTDAALPAVPKRILSVLQSLAVKYVGTDFHINTFWAQLREPFPDVAAAKAKGCKPTATALMQQAYAAVSEEDQAVQAAVQSTTKESYESLLRLMQEYRSSGEDSPEPPVVPEEQGAVGHDITIDPNALETTIGAAVAAAAAGTSVQVLSKFSHATTAETETTDSKGSEKRITRKRTVADATQKSVEVKKTKTDPKK